MKTKLQESAIKTFPAPNFQKNDSSQGSINDLNDLEKKGILSWDNASDLSNHVSSQEKLNENRKNFLNELLNFNNDGYLIYKFINHFLLIFFEINSYINISLYFKLKFHLNEIIILGNLANANSDEKKSNDSNQTKGMQ